MNNKPKVQKVTYPSKQLTQDEWVKEVNFGRMYVKPYNYFTGNVYNTDTITGTSLFNKIINFLNKIG